MNALRGEPEISPTLQRQVTTDRVSLPPFDGHRWCGGQAAWEALIGPAAASPGHPHERESSSLPARWRGNQDGLGYNGQDSLYLVVLPFSITLLVIVGEVAQQAGCASPGGFSLT
jgi:hypothetical protein